MVVVLRRSVAYNNEQMFDTGKLVSNIFTYFLQLQWGRKELSQQGFIYTKGARLIFYDFLMIVAPFQKKSK